ncbi:MAG TPA: 4-hydroxythreonine-4-phosphate dehydrogenase PdxA [Verrucomicrobiae bacterium]|nr:4-hydroxythreonine-4-phosphate dehydrogenase PdxA [Verrucomicrobiae bacterium]
MSWIGISLGDATGIGPEVTLKALAAEPANDATRFLLIGDEAQLRRANQHLNLPLHPYSKANESGRFFIHDPSPGSLPQTMAAGSLEAARAAVAWLKDGAQHCLQGELQALVTAPVNKETIIRAGHESFVGQTEFLSDLAHAKKTAMMLLGHDDRGRWLRVALATTHVPIKSVADKLTREKIETAIELAAKSCRDLGLPRARVGVCGLNPHAGEGGKMGTEEQTVVGPAVEAMQARGLDVIGPIPADTLFYRAFRGEFDVVVAMYHDQGLAPLKMIAFDSGVNWTLGLPFIRTSPDHGTAYDIAGKNLAKPGSMIAAIQLAKQLAAQL